MEELCLEKPKVSISPYCKKNNLVVELLSPGHCITSKIVTESDVNILGYCHGAVYFLLADTACGMGVAERGLVVVTVNSTYNFMRSARAGDTVFAESKEVKCGKNLCIMDCEVKDQHGTLLGTGTFTFFVIGDKSKD